MKKLLCHVVGEDHSANYTSDPHVKVPGVFHGYCS